MWANRSILPDDLDPGAITACLNDDWNDPQDSEKLPTEDTEGTSAGATALNSNDGK